MTSDARAPRSVRTVFVADHLWEVVQDMAQDMGVQPDDLVNQALFTWARLNGYTLPSHAAAHAERAAPRRPTPAPAPAKRASVLTTQPLESYPDEAPPDEGLNGYLPDDDAEAPAEEAAEDLPSSPDPADSGRMSRLVDAALSELPPDEVEDASDGPPLLYVSADDAPPMLVTGARFVVGRGKHCDLIVDSNRVSREHVAITLEGDGYVLEDLNSSNGTWLHRERVTRRTIEEGDVFTLGATSLRCSFESPDDQPAAER